MSFEPGDRVEYAAHAVSAIVHDPTAEHIVAAVARIGDEFVPHFDEAGEPIEDWRPATVIDVNERPGQPGVVDATTVVRLDPDDGPPLEINALLVRSRA